MVSITISNALIYDIEGITLNYALRYLPIYIDLLCNVMIMKTKNLLN
jgi:hypothetical protein